MLILEYHCNLSRTFSIVKYVKGNEILISHNWRKEENLDKLALFWATISFLAPLLGCWGRGECQGAKARGSHKAHIIWCMQNYSTTYVVVFPYKKTHSFLEVYNEPEDILNNKIKNLTIQSQLLICLPCTPLHSLYYWDNLEYSLDCAFNLKTNIFHDICKPM